jgi:hypothetical protein
MGAALVIGDEAFLLEPDENARMAGVGEPEQFVTADGQIIDAGQRERLGDRDGECRRPGLQPGETESGNGRETYAAGELTSREAMLVRLPDGEGGFGRGRVGGLSHGVRVREA